MSRYSDNSGYSESYAPPVDRHNGGVYREVDPREDRAYRFAAHVLQGPLVTKKSSRHSSPSHKDHHGSSRSSRSSTSSRYTSSSKGSHEQQQAQYQQQQFQQQQQRYPGPQPGYRPAGGPGYGPGYGPGVQQRQPNIYGRNQQEDATVLVAE